MRQMLAAGLIALALASPGMAKILIVPREGATIWTTAARKDGDTVYYLDEQGREQPMPLDKVQQIVPGVVRGKHYTPATVTKVLKAIETLMQERPNLRKQLQPLHDEWQALGEPLPDFEKRLTAAVADFAASHRDKTAYLQLKTAIGMLRYRDLAGAFTERLTAAEEKAREDFFSVNRERLQQLEQTAADSVQAFRDFRKQAEDILSVEPPPALRAAVQQKLEAKSGEALQNLTRQAVTIFAKGESVDRYLATRALLLDLRRYVALGEQQQRALDERLPAIAATMRQRHPHYGFKFQGYPLTRDDYTMLGKVKDYASFFPVGSQQIDASAFLFPLGPPRGLRAGATFELPLRVVFNRTPPAAGRFGLGIFAFTQDGIARSYMVALPTLSLKDGRGEIRLRGPMKGLDPTVLAEQRQRGQPFNVHVFLAHQPNGSDRADNTQTWQPLSLACSIPMRP